MNRPISRRNFLGQANCAAVTSLPLLNTLLNLKVASTVAAASNTGSDYKSLVCLFLSGGIDTFNVLVPRGTAEYAEYSSVRRAIALPNNALLPINPQGLTGLQLGLHPALTGIQSLFEAGHAAYVSNVGTLVQPVTKSDFHSGKSLPLGLFSHSDQQEQWQTSMPNTHTAQGWGGRVADMLKSLNSLNSVSMNMSLTGTNIWQAGDSVFEYTVGSGGASLNGYDKANTNKHSTVPIRTKAVNSQLEFQYQHLLSEAFQTQKIDALGAAGQFTSATANVQLPAGVTFPNTSLGHQFQMIAKIILSRGALGQNRQTFFVEYGGWDHHNNLLANQAAMLPQVDAAVKAFYDCLAAASLQNNVTLFTCSDFSRTLSTDGDGADHAWGGNHLVLGGAVKGQRVYGRYPSLALGSSLDVGRGRLIPQVGVDSYFAELALWFGVPKSSLSLVLPNIGAFYDTRSSSPPVGFLG
jgi:uncharacterized protein (DUF1501 family)